MDKPTAALTMKETEELFTTLKKMSNEGIPIILIEHKYIIK